ncbi:MAG: ribonuclease HII [Bryobacterales bacterium]|nr:ribonuclease HII [Bryobacterales bacterium]
MQAERAAGRFRCEGTRERELRVRGFRLIAGADEAGRGSLFGPVFAAAVILAPERPIRGLNDSKLLEPERREVLAGRIRERAAAWAVAAVDASIVDRVNIYQASRMAMRLAVELLYPKPDFVLTDAVMLDIPLPQEALIHGDARCHAIAAASILAKVDRDQCMRRWDEVFPGYGLAGHKGYATPDHLEALRALGPSPMHRFSFEPVRACAPGFSRQLGLFDEPGAASCL